jgi:hypothetical protein
MSLHFSPPSRHIKKNLLMGSRRSSHAKVSTQQIEEEISEDKSNAIPAIRESLIEDGLQPHRFQRPIHVDPVSELGKHQRDANVRVHCDMHRELDEADQIRIQPRFNKVNLKVSSNKPDDELRRSEARNKKEEVT